MHSACDAPGTNGKRGMLFVQLPPEVIDDLKKTLDINTSSHAEREGMWDLLARLSPVSDVVVLCMVHQKPLQR